MTLQPILPIRGGNTIPYHSLIGNVEFNHVNFTYPTRADHQVLTDFSLNVNGGRMVALVGPSGSGKSIDVHCSFSVQKLTTCLLARFLRVIYFTVEKNFFVRTGFTVIHCSIATNILEFIAHSRLI